MTEPARKRPYNPSMSTQQPHDGTDAQPTLGDFGTTHGTRSRTHNPYRDDPETRIRSQYRTGRRPDEIAATLEADLETVARTLRHQGVLEPWDDPQALAMLHHEYEYTLQMLADAFGNERHAETIRTRMDQFDIERNTNSSEKILTEMDGDEIDDLFSSPGETTDTTLETAVATAALRGAADAHGTDVRSLTIPEYEDYAEAVEGPTVETILEHYGGWNAAKAETARETPTEADVSERGRA